MVLFDISRVQRNVRGRNAAFRLVLDGSDVIAMTNTGGGSLMMDYRQAVSHGAERVLQTGLHTAEVQCKLPSTGGVAFVDDDLGDNQRRLSVIQVPGGD
eukprot:1896145-Prymnesium_polylepis.1